MCTEKGKGGGERSNFAPLSIMVYGSRYHGKTNQNVGHAQVHVFPGLWDSIYMYMYMQDNPIECGTVGNPHLPPPPPPPPTHTVRLPPDVRENLHFVIRHIQKNQRGSYPRDYPHHGQLYQQTAVTKNISCGRETRSQKLTASWS